MRRWDIGPVSTKRIINNLMKTGWCQARKTRLSNGTFHIIYEIRDEPGPTLTEDEIRAALSLVSSEAGDDESDVDAGPNHPSVSEHPPPCQRGVADQRVADNGVAPKKELLNPDLEKPDSPNRARVFADVQREWPIEHILSSVTAEAAYVALNDSDADDCYRGLKPYLADCKVQNRKVCDLTTFIRERRWERFVKPATAAQFFIIKPNTPQWFRWREYRAANGQSLTLMDTWAREGKTMTERSEWPPPMPKRDDDHAA
jgi:hypothetical protein